jgi:small-conductance mechanosensitive channel
MPPTRQIVDPRLKLALQVLVGIVALITGHVFGDLLQRKIRQHAAVQQKTWVHLVSKAVYASVMVMVMATILMFSGFRATGIIAVISTFGFAIGLSLQGTLSDVASGLMLSFFNTFELGDVIRVDETEGRVLDFTLVYTIIQDRNNTIVTVPNRMIQRKVIKNYSKSKTYMFSFDVLVSNNENDDFDKIIDTLKTTLHAFDPSVTQKGSHKHTDPSARVYIHEMGGVGTTVRIKVPMTMVDLYSKQQRARTLTRRVLTQLGVRGIDNP